ncbi:MAG: siroheme synthase CysG [Pseudomonadota bacterium]
MKTFPMFIDLADRTVAIVGGGEQAAQKARLLLKTEADLALIAPELDDELSGLVRKGRARHVSAVSDRETLSEARIVFVCTGCAGADAAIAAEAKSLGKLVNVVDRPDLCDLITPAIVDRDPLVVAIGTEGAAPVLARQVKTRLEEMLEPRLGDLVSLAGRLRDAVARRISKDKRRVFWRWVFNEAPRRMFASGREQEAARLLKAAIEAGGPEAPEVEQKGLVSLVGSGPGSADLMTLRGVQRLQEADIIFYDRLVDPGVLELARRDAERVFVGKRHGSALEWPQSRINGVIVAAAREGKRVVRLKSGDPLVFGRAAEEAAACEAAEVDWEVVPGVTAALAAAAEARLFPTDRGATRHLVLTTGASPEGAAEPDLAGMARPGVTLAVYMGVRSSAETQANLLRQGAPEDAPVTIVEGAESRGGRRLHGALGELSDLVKREGVKSPAMVFIQWPDPQRAAFAAERLAAS